MHRHVFGRCGEGTEGKRETPLPSGKPEEDDVVSVVRNPGTCQTVVLKYLKKNITCAAVPLVAALIVLWL